MAQQQSIQVIYTGVVVGDYVVDLLIEEKVLIELKAIKAIDEIHVAQCLNYLKATGHAICLLVNFGKPKAEIGALSTIFNPCSSASICGCIFSPDKYTVGHPLVPGVSCEGRPGALALGRGAWR